MVTTVLEARVEPGRWDELKSGYEQLIAQLPPQLLATDLLQGEAERTIWRISTDWVSMEGLQEYRKSVETPDGVRLFREVGAEPRLMVFEIVAGASRAGGNSVASAAESSPRKLPDSREKTS